MTIADRADQIAAMIPPEATEEVSLVLADILQAGSGEDSVAGEAVRLVQHALMLRHWQAYDQEVTRRR